MEIWQEMQEALEAQDAAGMRRRPVQVDSACGREVVIAGRRIVCLCSNDYLGLANDPAVKAAAVSVIGTHGVGAGASRLVSGTSSLHAQLERELAAFKGTQAAVVTSTGWMANHVAIAATVRQGDLVLCDKLNHASIMGAAGASGARLRTYPHLDMQRLESLLQRHRAEHRRCLIVTDSLFSMDGDVAPLSQIVQIKRRFDAQLLIDEAHATGVLGEHGRGAADLLGVESEIDITVGTLSKAIGALGGFVAGPVVLAETIRNAARAYIYTTALPPAMCAAALAALQIIRNEPSRREHLARLSRLLRMRLGGAAGCTEAAEATKEKQSKNVSCSGQAFDTPIIPIILGDAPRAVAASKALLEAGFLVPAIRPPTVPRCTSRLRVSLSAAHTPDDVERFATALKETTRTFATKAADSAETGE